MFAKSPNAPVKIQFLQIESHYMLYQLIKGTLLYLSHLLSTGNEERMLSKINIKIT